MKHLLALLFVATSVLTMSSCNEMVENDGKTKILEDSMINVFPTWQALQIKIKDNRTKMNVVIGDATFYKASPDEKNKKADELARMILRIYGKGNYLEKGRLTVTANVRNEDENPADGITIPIDFEALKKDFYPK